MFRYNIYGSNNLHEIGRHASILRAENETRTRDPNLGKVVLYQLSYFRIALLKQKRLFRFCECKGMKFLFNLQIFFKLFYQKKHKRLH